MCACAHASRTQPACARARTHAGACSALWHAAEDHAALDLSVRWAQGMHALGTWHALAAVSICLPTGVNDTHSSRSNARTWSAALRCTTASGSGGGAHACCSCCCSPRLWCAGWALGAGASSVVAAAGAAMQRTCQRTRGGVRRAASGRRSLAAGPLPTALCILTFMSFFFALAYWMTGITRVWPVGKVRCDGLGLVRINTGCGRGIPLKTPSEPGAASCTLGTPRMLQTPQRRAACALVWEGRTRATPAPTAPAKTMLQLSRPFSPPDPGGWIQPHQGSLTANSSE